jgi:Family of unknown function (DUF5682)
LSIEEAALRVRLALAPANEPAHAAAWVEGFLKGSGMLLLHDEKLRQVLDDWVTGLQSFTTMLPLLRRTFATFTPPERRRLGELAKLGMPATAGTNIGAQSSDAAIDRARAEATLPLIAKLLGVDYDDR